MNCSIKREIQDKNWKIKLFARSG